MPACIVIADDLTGANATGVLLQKQGFSAYTVLQPERAKDNSIRNGTVIVVPTDSRSIPDKEAYERVYDALEKTKSDEVIFYSKRIDSTLRGNLGIETDAFLDNLGEEYMAICVPCFPTSGRILCGGHLLVNGIPLDRTEVAVDPKCPIHTSNVISLFKKQTKYEIDSLTLTDIELGKEHLTKQFKDLKEKGVRIVICDAVTQEDIDVIADAVMDSGIPVVSVDPGVFTAALGKRLIPSEKKMEGRKVMCVIGSVNGVARKQTHTLLKKMDVYTVYIDAEKVLDPSLRESEIARCAKELINGNDAHEVYALIGSGINPDKVLSFEEYSKKLNKTDEELSKIINQAFAEVVHKVLLERDDFYALYTTGGDITAAVNDVLETSGLVLLDEVVPLAGYGVTLGGKFSGLQFISKGGMVGDDNAMVTCVQYLIDHF